MHEYVYLFLHGLSGTSHTRRMKKTCGHISIESVSRRHLPVIVLFAVYVAVSGIARELRVQRQLALGAPQAADVPAHVHRGQIETVVNRSAATGAASPAVAAVLRVGCQSRTVDVLQHVRPHNMTCANTRDPWLSLPCARPRSAASPRARELEHGGGRVSDVDSKPTLLTKPNHRERGR